MKPFLPDPKPETERDEDYLDFIRNKHCLLCHESAEPHHESGLGDSGGMGKKCSDYFAIQLCRTHHDQREYIGFDTFWKWHWVDPWQIVMDNLIEYLQKKDNKIHAKRMIIDFLIERIKEIKNENKP